jgi:hypothetical protein
LTFIVFAAQHDKLEEALIKFVLTSMGATAVVAMKSVPPRGSGWVVDFNQTRKTMRCFAAALIAACSRTHPLPRGGTDFLATRAAIARFDKLKMCRTLAFLISETRSTQRLHREKAINSHNIELNRVLD